jgi:hypothetical protein
MENSSDDADPKSEYRKPDDQKGESDQQVASATAEPYVPPSETNCKNTCKNEKHYLDYATFGVEVLGLVGLAIYCVITYGAYCANKTAAEAAKGAATAATNSVTLQQNSTQTDQRAWVSVSDVEFLPRGSSFDVDVVFTNTGKTPAKGFTIRAAGELLQNGGIPNGKETLLPGHGVIAPNGTYHSALSPNGYYERNLGTLTVHGRIDYADVFGGSHWTKFCYYWIPNNGGRKGGFAPCETGNSIDDYHPPTLLK